MKTFVLNFQKQFADDVLAGRKRQTIRKERKDGRRPEIGDCVALYTGLRTNSSRHLLDADCVAVLGVTLDARAGSITVGEERLDAAALEAFAQMDGFADAAAMFAWFLQTHGEAMFHGFCVRWRT